MQGQLSSAGIPKKPRLCIAVMRQRSEHVLLRNSWSHTQNSDPGVDDSDQKMSVLRTIEAGACKQRLPSAVVFLFLWGNETVGSKQQAGCDFQVEPCHQQTCAHGWMQFHVTDTLSLTCVHAPM